MSSDPLPTASLEPVSTLAGLPPRGFFVLVAGQPVASIPLEQFRAAADQLERQAEFRPPFPLE